jgi:hypothetical protein
MNAPVLLTSRPRGEVVLSASQLGTWDLCKRRWAYEYIWKIRSPPHPSAVLGTKVHSLLEAWLRDGTVPQPISQDPMDIKAARIATRMITTLVNHGVQPGHGVVERRFYLRTRRGHYYTGFIDWSGIFTDMMPTVLDHKTSSNVTRYGKTAADLHNDIQAVLYAVAGFVGFGVDTLRLFWNYGETKGRFMTKPVETIVHLPVVANKFESVIEEEAAIIVAHKKAETHPECFPQNVDSCGAFGGCPHRQRCNPQPQQFAQRAFQGLSA